MAPSGCGSASNGYDRDMADTGFTVIFDVDGTLVDSTYHHAIAWQRAFRACALYVPVWQVHRSIGMGGDRLVAAVLGDVVEDKIGDTLRERHAEAYRELVGEVRPLPGGRHLVEVLHGRGNRVCVASSGSREDTEDALDNVGIRGFVQSTISGDNVESSKPAPDILGVALEQAGGGPAVVVGDSVYDVQSAAGLGLPCVAVRTGGFGAAELESAGAELVVDDLTCLIDTDWAVLVSSPART